MDINKNTPEVVSLIREIEAVRKKDDRKQLELCQKLYDMAQANGNEDLKDFASCSLGEACCQNHDFSKAIFYLTAGINGLAKTDEYALICRCYNEIGIILKSEGHYVTAEDAF